MKATWRQIESRKEALELSVGYVDRATEWWTDWLSDEIVIRYIKGDVLPDLWEEFDRAIARQFWTCPVELIAQLDRIASMVGKDPVVRNVQRAKEAIAAYSEVDLRAPSAFQENAAE